MSNEEIDELIEEITAGMQIFATAEELDQALESEEFEKADQSIINEILAGDSMLFGRMRWNGEEAIRCYGGTCGCPSKEHPLGPTGPACPQNMIYAVSIHNPKWCAPRPKKVIIRNSEVYGLVY